MRGNEATAPRAKDFDEAIARLNNIGNWLTTDRTVCHRHLAFRRLRRLHPTGPGAAVDLLLQYIIPEGVVVFGTGGEFFAEGFGSVAGDLAL